MRYNAVLLMRCADASVAKPNATIRNRGFIMRVRHDAYLQVMDLTPPLLVFLTNKLRIDLRFVGEEDRRQESRGFLRF